MIDLGGSSDIVAWENLKIQSGGKTINFTSDRSVRHPDSNCVNGTPIEVRMKKIEAIRFGLNLID